MAQFCWRKGPEFLNFIGKCILCNLHMLLLTLVSISPLDVQFSCKSNGTSHRIVTEVFMTASINIIVLWYRTPCIFCVLFTKLYFRLFIIEC
jgi:hypothetical protein